MLIWLYMKAVIIGSGIGGMATAIRLASLGFETEVFEQNSFYGGKINSKQIEHIDLIEDHLYLQNHI